MGRRGSEVKASCSVITSGLEKVLSGRQLHSERGERPLDSVMCNGISGWMGVRDLEPSPIDFVPHVIGYRNTFKCVSICHLPRHSNL